MPASLTAADHQYMAKAIQLARKGLYTTHPNPRVGCVITKDNRIIGEGWHQRAGQAHAEINALSGLSPQQTQGATAYVTLEPCSHTGKTPPCSQALIKAGIRRVVVAMQDPNPLVAGKGLQQLRAAGIETHAGIMQSAARALNPGFIKRMEHGIPWVSIKLAMSLDGRTAMASGESKWITSPEARRDVQFLRAKASAILSGQGTVLADNPSLNVRLNAEELGISGTVRQPQRIILDPQCLTPADAKMLDLPGKTLIITQQSQQSTSVQALQNKGAEIITLPADHHSNHLPLTEVMQILAKQEINEIHVEAGATLCGALLQEKLVDELIIYMAPHIMGAEARGLLKLPGLEHMQDRINLQINDIRAVGKDWRITARPLQQS